MKTLNFFGSNAFPAGIAFLIFLSACHKEHCTEDDSAKEPEPLTELDQSYRSAQQYNDSLAMCHDGTIMNHDSLMEHYYDNQYHYYDSLMALRHNSCHSSNSESGGMMGSGGMMSGNSGSMNCGCGSESHAKMDVLHQDHVNYHPI